MKQLRAASIFSTIAIALIGSGCVHAINESTWTCNIRSIGNTTTTKEVGEVTIDWGHTKEDAAWACNAWEKACEGKCTAEPAVSAWSCYNLINTQKKIGEVTIDWGHTAEDAAWACNQWNTAACAGTCKAAAAWECKLNNGNNNIIAVVDIWWSSQADAATWACNKWITKCDNSCHAENWLWTYFNHNVDYLITINPKENRGTWEGFGAGLSWWAHAVGQTPYQSLYNKLFFGQDPVKVLDMTVPGLGMNIVRYNVGGGGLPSDNIAGAVDRVPSIVPWHKDIDGFWIDWYNKNPDSSSWDWGRDARQRSVLDTLVEQGVTVEFVSHAPMWWMMDSKSSSGGNLQKWNYRDHAIYLATVVDRARAEWGVNVSSVEPFNEPTAGWWTYPVQQEGANIPVSVQAEIVGYLREELDTRNLKDVVIAASDENNVVQARTTYEALKGHMVSVGGRLVSAASLIGKVNVHGYDGLAPWRDNAARSDLRRTVGDAKRIWMTEYGDGEESGLALAQSIIADINFLRATAWMYWQPLEPYSAWGLLNGAYANPADETSASRGKPIWLYTSKYYIFAQFSRFLRPGYQILGSSDASSIVAYDKGNSKLVMVTLNNGPERTVAYDLSQFSITPSTVVLATYTSFDGSHLFQLGSATLYGTSLHMTMPAGTLHSIEIAVKLK